MPITSCEEWRTALNDGGYDYVVIGPDQRTQSESPIEAEWTGADGATAKLVDEDMIFVFEITGELDPASCAALDQLDYGGPMPDAETAGS